MDLSEAKLRFKLAESWMVEAVASLSIDSTCEKDFFLIKVAAEVAVLCHHLKSVNGVEQSDLERSIARLVCCDEYANVARKNIERAHHVLLPYLLLRVAGFQHRHLDASVEIAVQEGTIEGPEKTPHRQLDVNYFLGEAKLTVSAAKDPVQTMFDRRFSPLRLSVDDVYALTHIIFYETRFGTRSSSMRNCSKDLAELLNGLLVHFARIGPWDLLGELLICANCIPGCSQQIREHCTARFWSAQSERGFFYPSKVAQQRLVSSAKDKAIFKDCYHTTLVWMLLYASISSL